MQRLLILPFILLSACAMRPCDCSVPPSAPVTIPAPAPTPMPVLSWETNHPERAEWTKALVGYIDADFGSLDKAQDLVDFCPAYRSLERAKRIHLWSELFSAVAKFESSWNPKSASVDVGKPELRDTWSIGLLQMSVVDQSSYKLPLGYTYEDLITAKPNLHLGVKVMANRVEKYQKVKLTTGVYWAVLKPDGKYQHIAEITAMTKKLPFCAEGGK